MDGKFLYFLITYKKESKENNNDINFVVPEKNELKPICIYVDEQYENLSYYYNKIFKVNKSVGKGKEGNNYYFELEINNEKHIIHFDSKGLTFIYEVNLEVWEKITGNPKKISQNKEYYETIEYFIKAFEKNGEERLIDDLCKEAIELYANEKDFSLLIILFLKIYQKKDLCLQLLQIFKKMNENQKDNEKNMDGKPFLKEYISKFKSILSEAEEIIKNNNYNFIEFYGIIFCYLNNYDYKTFTSVINDLYIKKPNDLYEILLIYNSHFNNPINQNLDFLNKFISYIIENKDFPVFEKGLKFIRDIETFFNIIEKNKNNIFEKYNDEKLEKIIKLNNLKFKKDGIEDEPQNEIVTASKIISKNDNDPLISIKNKEKIFEVFNNIKSIINFYKEKKAFLIYFTNNFWRYILKYYNEPTQENIEICFKLREIFIQYYDLVLYVFNKKDEIFIINKEAYNYFERDEFAFILNLNIKSYNNNSKATYIEKLRLIKKYNPYYREPKYFNLVSCDIFDSLDLDQIDNNFIEEFKGMNFEYIFQKYQIEYIYKFIPKIKNIRNFNTVIKLINIKTLKDRNIYLDLLNYKYDEIIRHEIGLLTDEKCKEAINVVAKIAIINYVYETKDKKFDFINKRIKKLDRKIIPSIFIEIINQSFSNEDKHIKKEESKNGKIEKDEKEQDINIDYNEMKNFIFEEFSNKLDLEIDIDNIINLLDCLEEKDKKKEIMNDINGKEILVNQFLQKLVGKYLFTKDEFFSCNKNLKISLFYKLYEKGKIKKNEEEYYNRIIFLLDSIKRDIEGNIKKSKLEEFLINEPSLIRQSLSLIKIILEDFNPDAQYEELKRINDDINKNIHELIYIKDNILIYFEDTYQDIIKKIIEVLKNNSQKTINYDMRKIRDLIKETESLKDTVKKIEQVKNMFLFKIIYDMNSMKNERKNFERAYETLEQIKKVLKDNININILNNKYKEIFKEIKEKLNNSDDRATDFIKELIIYCEISNTNLIDELTILFKSKKYELDINSIKFFFENYFEKDNKDWNDRLPSIDYKNKWEENFQNIKEDLNKLRENGIYDYKNIGKYNKLFTCLYNKKEAIDFLFSKTSDEIHKLIDKINPNNRTINIKDIIDIERCIFAITEMRALKNNFKIFEYIKRLDDKTISQFENYSRIYSPIIKLDYRDDDISYNVYDKVVNIIREATFNILQDTENIIYINKNNEEIRKEGKIMEELIQIKNKIENNEDNEIKSKSMVLNFFKDLISNLEIITEYMNILRKKGSSLPINISIKITIDNGPNIKYFLDKKTTNFHSIREFLIQAKNEYISKLDFLYKNNLNLRFLYGKQFRTMMKHIENNYKIDSLLRYILNITNNDIPIIEGYKTVLRYTNDYINEYILYEEDSFNIISSYIHSLFNSNGKTLEEHYERMKITTDNLKGIYLYKCENNSMEEYIINLFWDKLAELPISQNILIINKETYLKKYNHFYIELYYVTIILYLL